MVIFHFNIISNLPMGVPLEWNVFFIFSLFYLFGHYGAIRVYDLHSPLLLIILIVACAVLPIAGNMLPRQISFLLAMRYYAGNWATSLWCFRPGTEDRIEAGVVKNSALVINQWRWAERPPRPGTASGRAKSSPGRSSGGTSAKVTCTTSNCWPRCSAAATSKTATSG
jgi:hypothetical protein